MSARLCWYDNLGLTFAHAKSLARASADETRGLHDSPQLTRTYGASVDLSRVLEERQVNVKRQRRYERAAANSDNKSAAVSSGARQ